MSAAMRNVQDQTKDTNLKLLSISIDPDVDTPEIIKRYANAFKADPNRWRLVGLETIGSLMVQE
jgi:cytochrome oxidase Cu insertion factor (SCO1/SenC/PrrC family)